MSEISNFDLWCSISIKLAKKFITFEVNTHLNIYIKECVLI